MTNSPNPDSIMVEEPAVAQSVGVVEGNSSDGESGPQAANGKADTASFAALLEEYDFNVPQRGDVLTGEVLSVHDSMILLDVGAKRDALVAAGDLARLEDEVTAAIQVGDTLPVYVLATPEDDDELMVSLSRGLETLDWGEADADMDAGVVLELPVVGLNRGGLLVAYRRLRGFVPNSHVSSLRFIRNSEERDRLKQDIVGQSLPLKVIEVDAERRRLVLSALEAEKERRKTRLAELNEGEILTGVVENLTDFGAFVNLGGVSGLVHISKLDWKRVNHPSEVLKAGDEVTVLVEQVDVERERISLNRQAVLPNPWQTAADSYSPGDELEGVVTNVVDFGAFVRVPAGVEGLVHVSEMPTYATDKPSEIVQRDETVKVRVLSVDPKRERLALSMLPLEPELDWVVEEDAQATPQASDDSEGQEEADAALQDAEAGEEVSIEQNDG